MPVDRAAAARRLQDIAAQVRLDGGIALVVGQASQRVEATALVASCLGSDHYLVSRLESWLPFSALRRPGQGSPATEFAGLLDAAATLVELGEDEAQAQGPAPSADPALWGHVSGLVDGALWDLIPGAVVTFVEDWFRRLAGNPPNKSGGKLYGRGVFAEVLRPGGDFALGSDLSEQEGWRDLGQGLAKAIGNDHRHAISNRVDAERLAWDVIGLGSLLIGEARRTYGDPDAGTASSR